MIVKGCEFAEKPIKVIIHNVQLKNSQIQLRSCFGGSVGPESLVNVLLAMDKPMQKSNGKIAGHLASRNKSNAWKKSTPFIVPHVNATLPKSIFTKIYPSICKISAPPYPAHSPSFNIIENALLCTKSQMNPDARDPSRFKKLVKRVFEEWKKSGSSL